MIPWGNSNFERKPKLARNNAQQEMSVFEAKKENFRRAFCTIGAINYTGQVLSLAESLYQNHPDIPLIVLTPDDTWHTFDDEIRGPNIKHITMADFRVYFDAHSEIPLRYILFQYKIVEALTAIKPMLLKYILQRLKIEQIVYVDPDTYFFSAIDDVWSELDSYEFLLTPHLVSFQNSNKALTQEKGILRSGIYNLGFLALKSTPEVAIFLDWWHKKLERHCLADVNSGLFTDQKWIDFLPGFVERFKILRHSGLNVAHWNLHERALSLANGKFNVNDQELKFFHFSGFDYRDRSKITNHQKKLLVDQFPCLGKVISHYHEKLVKFGVEKWSRVPYQLGFWSNGIVISDEARSIAYENKLWRQFPDPFIVGRSNCFFDWLFLSNEHRLSPFLVHLAMHVPEWKESFPDVTKVKPEVFIQWLKKDGLSQTKLEDSSLRVLKFVFANFKATTGPTYVL